jgi:hypothetical protein
MLHRFWESDHKKGSVPPVFICHDFDNVFDQRWHEHYGAPSGSTHKDKLEEQKYKMENAHRFVLLWLIPRVEVAFFFDLRQGSRDERKSDLPSINGASSVQHEHLFR